MFDVNDFDETLPGPFEWDVKRLAASLEIAATGRGFDDKVRAQVVPARVGAYRETIRGVRAADRSTSGTPTSTRRSCSSSSAMRPATPR